TGVQLSLAPLGKITGQLVLDPVPEGTKKDEAKSPDSSIGEILVTARREGKPNPGRPSSIAATPDEKGAVVFSNLAPETYLLHLNVTSKDWYFRKMSPGKSDKPAQRPRARPASASSGSDIAARGVTINAGEHVDALSIVVGRGAAS